MFEKMLKVKNTVTGIYLLNFDELSKWLLLYGLFLLSRTSHVSTFLMIWKPAYSFILFLKILKL